MHENTACPCAHGHGHRHHPHVQPHVSYMRQDATRGRCAPASVDVLKHACMRTQCMSGKGGHLTQACASICPCAPAKRQVSAHARSWSIHVIDTCHSSTCLRMHNSSRAAPSSERGAATAPCITQGFCDLKKPGLGLRMLGSGRLSMVLGASLVYLL